jgi:phosphoglycolate phosphatase
MTTLARLVLWDIDRTLLNVSDLIAEAITQAAADVLGTSLPSLAPIVGRPESASMLDTLILNGLDESTARMRLPAALEALVRELRKRAHRFTTGGKVLPGVRTVLSCVAADPAFAQSLLTGGLRANAVEKLHRFGLHADLELGVGAYGDDAFDRPSLVGIARSGRRALSSGLRLCGNHPDR